MRRPSQMSLDDENIPIAVYDNLDHCDPRPVTCYAPVRGAAEEIVLALMRCTAAICMPHLVAELNQHYSFDQAKELVAQALKPLGDEYGQILQTGLNSRWISVEQRKIQRRLLLGDL